HPSPRTHHHPHSFPTRRSSDLFDGALMLKRAWESSNAGTILLTPTSVHYLQTQFRPEYARPAALLDPAVRKALAHTIDKAALAEDRKSTRLNSSHVKISYAVFC